MKSSFLGVVLAATLLLAPDAHAQTSFVPIGDPATDTLQLWSEIAASIGLIAEDAASAAGQVTSAMQHLASAALAPHSPNTSRSHAPRQLTSAIVASPAVAAETFPPSLPSAKSEQASSTESGSTQSRSPPAIAHSTIFYQLPQTSAFDASVFVTQASLSAQLQQLSNDLSAKFGAPNTYTVPQSVAADGNSDYPYAAENSIDNLSNVTITNANLTASEIPALGYLPLAGGTLTGTLNVPILSASSTNYGVLTATNASTTAFSNFGTAYFGGTATSSFDSAGDLNLAGVFTAASTTATSTFAGNISVGGNLNFNGKFLQNGLPFVGSQWTTTGSTVSYASGSVVIGTTTANHEFDVWGTNNTPIGITTGDPTLTVTNAGSILGNGSSVAFQGVDTAGSEITLGRISDISTSLTAGAASGNLAFFTRNGGAQQQDMTILADGNVGIGTAAPTSTLSVNGSFSIGATSSLATFGSETVSDGSFTTNPSGTWTLGTNWSWDSTNDRASYSGSGGPIAVISINDGGQGYTNGDTITISGGSGDATYTATVSSGKVTHLTQVSPGTSYTSGTNVSTTGGTGTGLNVSIVRIANSANTLTTNIATSSSNPTTSYTFPQGSGNVTWTGTPYQVSFTIANYSGAGWVDVTLGQVSAYYNSNGTYTSFLISTSSALTFTPTGDFTGEITNVSAKVITQLPALEAVNNSDGSPGLEIRSGGALKWNTFVGVGAGENYTSALTVDDGFNTGVGYYAMYSNTSGANNTAIGFYSLFSNTSGFANVAVGSDALESNTTGKENTGLGLYSLYTNTTGVQNTAVGYYSLLSNTTGTGNVASGYEASGANTTGSNNVADGYAALYGNNSSGSNNVAVGYEPLISNTTGGNNVALGYISLDNNTIGSNNVSSGYESMRFNTTGGLDVAIGAQSLYNATSAPSSSYNTAVGYQAMMGGTTGSFAISGTLNVALGAGALNKYTAGSDNTALGTDAMLDATTSQNDTAVGYFAGRGTSNNDNFQGLSALGYETGYNLANGSNYNTLIGYQAGYNLTTGADNILIGSATSSTGIANLTTGSQNILIGENDSLPSATGNGQLDIGNLIYGTGLGSTGSTVSTGNVGIGTTTPATSFSIAGNDYITGGEGIGFVNTTAGTLKTSGSASIGTSTPSSRLTVWGVDAASSTLAFNVVNSASTTVLAVFDGGNAQLSGSLSQSSDQRLKTNIQSLDASSSLAAINALNPVTFNWVDPNKGTTLQLGFIAQQVLPIFPNLVSTTSPTALTPDGTLSLNYIGLISPIVAAIQALDQEISNLAGTVASFAQSFVSNTITANNELCVGSTCVTPAQFQAMVAAANLSQSSGQGSGSAQSSNASTTPDTPPVIQINGDNPAIVQVGDTYNDLGATITGPEQDLNLGIQTYLNGALTANTVIDTSEPATDTIDYVVTDQNGLTSTTTRTIIIQPVEAPSIVPSDDAGVGDTASSTPASSSATTTATSTSS